MNYGYNLGGTVTSVSMSDWSQQVNYSYDSGGRLTGVTGSGFTNTRYTSYPTLVTESVPTFISSIGYRAWGAVKQMTYGNNAQLAMGYNGRLQGTQYQLSLKNWDGTNYTAGSTYNYYPDGKISYAGRLDNNNFDRKYTYDQVGRVQDALTGSEARGGTTADGPFKQHSGYDGWSNTTTETSRLWTGNSTTVNSSFSNNRRQDFGYDANGFVTDNYDTSLWYHHDYDASGKRTHFIPNIDSVGGQPVLETNDYLDGAGQPVKHVNTQRWQDPDTGYINTNNTNTYYLHSTALGGQLVAQLDAQGNKTESYVYLQGMKLATEVIWNASAHYARIEWQHTEPVTGSSITSNYAGNLLRTQELDPLGADVTSPPDPPDPFSYKIPTYMDPKAGAASLIQIEGGPSQDYLDANAAWGAAMTAEYDKGLAEYYWSKGDRDAAQRILANDPNVGLTITGPGAGALAERLGGSLTNGSFSVWGATAAAALGMVYTPQELRPAGVAQARAEVQNPTVSVTVSADVPPMEKVNCPHGPAVSATGRGTTLVLSYDDGTQEVRQGGTHSWRNYNPGNIRPGYLEGEIGKAGGFTIFSSEERGQAAIIENLARPQYEGKTVYGAIEAWAPPKENNTEAYKARVHSLTGLDGGTLLSDLNRSGLESVASAIRTVEVWTPGNVTCWRQRAP